MIQCTLDFRATIIFFRLQKYVLLNLVFTPTDLLIETFPFLQKWLYPSLYTTLFQRSSNIMWTLWTLDERCFDVLCRLRSYLRQF